LAHHLGRKIPLEQNKDRRPSLISAKTESQKESHRKEDATRRQKQDQRKPREKLSKKRGTTPAAPHSTTRNPQSQDKKVEKTKILGGKRNERKTNCYLQESSAGKPLRQSEKFSRKESSY